MAARALPGSAAPRRLRARHRGRASAAPAPLTARLLSSLSRLAGICVQSALGRMEMRFVPLTARAG